MKSKWTIICATCVLVASLLQGCLVAAVGAGIGAAKYGSSKQKTAYSDYRTTSEKTNFEREKEGMKPNKVLTYEEWRKGEENIEEDKK